MTDVRLGIALTALIVGVAGCAADDPPGMSECLASCGWVGASVHAPIRGNADQQMRMNWTACVNNTCAEFHVEEQTRTGPEDFTSFSGGVGTLSLKVSCYVGPKLKEDGDAWVQVPDAWRLEMIIVPANIADGDEYRIQAVDPLDGSMVFQLSRTVTYARNGPMSAAACGGKCPVPVDLGAPE